MIVSISDGVIIALASAAGIAAKEFGGYLLKKKANGKDKEAKADIKKSIDEIKEQTDQIPLIQKDLEGFNKRCDGHLRNQDKINTRCEEGIGCLEKKMFEHVRDGH